MTRNQIARGSARAPWVLAAVVLVAVTAMVTSRVVSDEKGEPPAMNEEMQKMMEAYAKASTPGEHHKHLGKLVGTWSAKSKFWMEPGGEPTEGTATATWKPLFEGRYVMLNYKGDSPMGPFEGIGITGYDNMTKKYVDVWIDSMSTAIMSSTGTCDAAGRVYNYIGDGIDPITQQKKTIRSVVRMVSDTEMHFEMFDKTPEGKEFRNLEIIYSKK